MTIFSKKSIPFLSRPRHLGIPPILSSQNPALRDIWDPAVRMY
jgi:hypothetical protein